MGLFVFLLIVGPATALMYFPLTVRQVAFQRMPARGVRESEGLIPAAAKGIDSIRWSRSADEHFRSLKNAA
jgi:hypothetical protein